MTGGHTSSLQEVLMFYLINEMIVVGSTYWNMVFSRDPGDVWKDDEGIARSASLPKMWLSLSRNWNEE
jgi:multimeric flavodoxin WrbA